MLHNSTISKHKYRIIGGLSGATLGYVTGNLAGAVVGSKIGYELGRFKDENKQSEIPKYLIEQIPDF